MYILYFLCFLLLAAGLALVARPLTVLLHELGHATAALLLTRQNVTVYIGTYGNPDSSVKRHLGRLEVFLRRNPFSWQKGLCMIEATSLSLNRQLIFILAGPIASLTIAIPASYFIFAYDAHGLLKLFLVIFMSSALIDFFFNIIPRNQAIQLYDGSVTHNDGYNLMQVLYYKRMPEEYKTAIELYQQERFSEAASLFNELLPAHTNNKQIHRFTIYCRIMENNYGKALELLEKFASQHEQDQNDMYHTGICHTYLYQYEKANSIFDTVLQSNPDHLYALNAKGYTLILTNQFEAAIPPLNRAIELDKGFSFAYNNRGIAKIKTGREDEGLQDIHHALQLNENAHCYLNLGIYHFDRQEYTQALEMFLKAREMDKTTHLLEQYLSDTRNKVIPIQSA